MTTPCAPDTRPCVVCGGLMTTTRRVQRFCGATCSKRWFASVVYKRQPRNYGELTCVVCGQTAIMRRPTQRTCLAPACVAERRGQSSSGTTPASSRWEAPIPSRPPAPPPPDPPRVRRLADGTVAYVVWAGDMRTGAGVRGGLLPERRSRPDTTTDEAPLVIEMSPRAQAAARLRMRKRAAERKRKRSGLHVSGPRMPQDAQAGEGARL